MSSLLNPCVSIFPNIKMLLLISVPPGLLPPVSSVPVGVIRQTGTHPVSTMTSSLLMTAYETWYRELRLLAQRSVDTTQDSAVWHCVNR